MKNRRLIGAVYEKKAEEYLKTLGFEIVERNFCCRQGEIDLIARDKNALVFVEVKYRKTEKYGLPAEAIDKRKQQKLYQTARYYLCTHGYGEEQVCRFDAVLILGEEISLIQNAFGGI